MTKKYQIRNLPEELHRKIKTMAAETGQSMEGIIIMMLEEGVARHQGNQKLKGE